MTKKRTMNELRQEKTYGYKAPFGMTHEEEKSKVGKDIAGDEFMLKQAKDLIVNELQDRFYDVIFQAVADEMSKNYMFRQNNYLTEAGEELFEDAWFEWYHEQHGDILYRILKKLEP
tara:strand:- start:184 stop:534 length:351 start_codon:yes stop_codon:yes gene_type:complete